MFLRQLMEQTSDLDKKIVELYSTERQANRAVAMLLFAISPKSMYDKFNKTHTTAMIGAFSAYPKPMKLPELVKLLDQYTAKDSQNDLVKAYYNFSKQEVAAGLKQIRNDRTKGISGPDRLYAEPVTTAPSTPKPQSTKPEQKPTPAPSSSTSKWDIDRKMTKQEYSKPYTEYSNKPIDTNNWDLFDVPDQERIIKYPEGANVTGVIGNITEDSTLYERYLMYIAGIAMGRDLADRLAVFNNKEKSSDWMSRLVRGKDPFYPGEVDINRAINLWNKSQSYNPGNTKYGFVNVDGENKYYTAKLHALSDIPRYMWITPELADMVRKNYKADQEDARRGAIDLMYSYTGPQRRTTDTSIQQHWVDYDLEVFAANLATLNKLGANDKLNNIKDPMLQLAMMGDPRQKKIAKFGEWDKVRFEVTPTGYLGIYKSSVGTVDGKSGDSTALTLMDRALGLDQTALSKTLAHEMRHRAFHIIMAIPELRDAMPKDLRKGGVWWDSWGGLYRKSDFGATAEHAMLYTMDWGTQIPERRMDFFDNKLFNTQDYPLSYWRNLYYEASKAVGEFLKKVGAKEITPNNLMVVDPDNPERKEQRDTVNATLLQLKPGLAEMYRYIIETDQLDALKAVEDAYNFFDGLESFRGEFAMADQWRKSLDGRMSQLFGDLKYGNFSRALLKGIPRAREIVRKLEQKGPAAIQKEKVWTTEIPTAAIERTLEIQNKIIDDTEAALKQFKNIELLRPGVFRQKLSKGEIKPAPFEEIKELLPYTLSSLPDYNSGFVAADDAPEGQEPYIPQPKEGENPEFDVEEYLKQQGLI